MKKIYYVFVLIAFVCGLNAFANAPCDNEQGYTRSGASCQKPCPKPYTAKKCTNPCPVTQSNLCEKPCPNGCPEKVTPVCTGDNFLCTGKDKHSLYQCLNLSATQVCTAEKINDKYQLEVLSLNERLDCEYRNRGALKQNCTKRCDLRASKKVINDLKKERRKICECYEKEFKNILSEEQIKSYKKYKKQ